MSEASLPHCLKCMSVSYDCECEEPDLAPSLVSQIMSGELVDTRGRPDVARRAVGGSKMPSAFSFKSARAGARLADGAAR